MSVTIAKFSWRNIWRNKRRTYFTLISLTFGIMTIIFLRSYLAGFRTGSVEELIKTQTGHIKIADKEFLRLERILPREYMIDETQFSLLKSITSNISEVETLCGRIEFHGLLNHGEENENAVIIGIDPADADKTMRLSQSIVQGKYYSNSSDNQTLNLIIGKSLAEKLKASVSDELLLVTTDINYSTYALPFKIAGIFETGYSSMDKHNVFIPLDKAQEMLDYGEGVNKVMLFIKNPTQAVEIASVIENRLKSAENSIKAIPWQESDYIKSFLPFIDEMIDKIIFIFMLLVALVILNTMLMAVMERYQEFGIIKALGLKKGEVRKMVLMEAFYLGAIGSFIGGILGTIISASLEKTGINVSQMLGDGLLDKMDIPVPLLGKILYPDFSIYILVTSLVFGILTAVIAALYPAFKSAKMSPVEAFHSQLQV